MDLVRSYLTSFLRGNLDTQGDTGEAPHIKKRPCWGYSKKVTTCKSSIERPQGKSTVLTSSSWICSLQKAEIANGVIRDTQLVLFVMAALTAQSTSYEAVTNLVILLVL